MCGCTSAVLSLPGCKDFLWGSPAGSRAFSGPPGFSTPTWTNCGAARFSVPARTSSVCAVYRSFTIRPAFGYKAITVRLLVLVFAFGAAAASAAEKPAAVCLDDRVGVGARAMQAFEVELNALGVAALANCSAAAGVRISIRTYAPSRYPRALGLAWTGGGRVLPGIELYTANILKTLAGQAGAERFGRALARVAFHELQHYTRQQHGHDEHGLFTPALNAFALLTAQ